MTDDYPALASLPPAALVPKELQPDYPEPAGLRVSPAANVAQAILGQGRRDDIALIHHESGRTSTFGELETASARLANVLEQEGLRIGDRIAIRCPNRPEAIVAALAVWRAGGIVVPTPAAARERDLRFLLEDTGARGLIACGGPTFDDVPSACADTDVAIRIVLAADETPNGWAAWDDVLRVASPRYDDGPLPENLPAIIWHTGGTTGTPKACYHTHRRYLLGGLAYGAVVGSAPGRRFAAAAPVGHALGFLCHTTFSLVHGASAVMVEEFARPECIVDAIRSHGVDTFIAITATWARMLDVLEGEPDPGALVSLKTGYAMWQSATSARVYDAWKERGVELLNNFGSTAFATWVLAPRAGEHVPRASLGRATPGYEVRAIEGGSLDALPVDTMGRMAVRGPTGLTYWNRLEQQQRDVVDGWTLVDDLISIDERGYATYFGRTDYVISSAGYKIAPLEVEEVLARHPAVAEVGVIGAPDSLRQEIVCAFVVLADPAGAEPTKELQDYVKAHLSPYKYPRRIEYVDALPRDHVGKLQPRVLKDWAEERSRAWSLSS